MDETKDLIVKNLVELRTQAGMTQLQLAEMLNYSDKAVSKWERGEALPDIRVLIRLSEIYGVTVDDLVKSEAVHTDAQPRKRLRKKRLLITLLSAGLVWFIATCIFTIFYFIPKTTHFAYLTYVFAPFVTGIVLTVLSARWGNRLTTALACSLLLWAFVMIFHLFVTAFIDFTQIYFLYIVAAVFELLIVLWFVYRRYAARKGK